MFLQLVVNNARRNIANMPTNTLPEMARIILFVIVMTKWISMRVLNWCKCQPLRLWETGRNVKTIFIPYDEKGLSIRCKENGTHIKSFTHVFNNIERIFWKLSSRLASRDSFPAPAAHSYRYNSISCHTKNLNKFDSGRNTKLSQILLEQFIFSSLQELFEHHQN